MALTPTVLLFVPGDRPERFEKAIAAGPDAVILDLEDAVAPGRKEAARAAVSEALRAGIAAFVRVNPPQSAAGRADLTALAGGPPPAGIMLPKAQAAEDVQAVAAAVNAPVLAILESVAGFDGARAIAAHPAVAGLAFGAYDLCAELGARPVPEVLATFRALCVMAARAAGRYAIDTPFVDIADADGLVADALRSRDFGFDGKAAIHPSQVGPIRMALTPTAAELARAQAVVDALASGGVAVVDGKMVDPPLLASAQRVLARAPIASRP